MGSKTLGQPSVTNPYISPNYTANDWKALDLNNQQTANWQHAVEIFYNRINGRFLAPIHEIANHPDCQIQEFSGFSIIAIDCLLIETLHQFYKGIDETRSPHKDAFWDFFSNSTYFTNDFDTKQKSTIFYHHFRCGILHQAQTKKSSKIRIGMPSMVQQSIPGRLKEGLIIDRVLFHEALINEIKEYMNKLHNPANNPANQQDLDLRSNFVLKMNFICPQLNEN